MKVSELLREEPVVASPDESATSVWERMHAFGVDHVVVLGRDGAVQGTVSRTDLAGPYGGSGRRMGRTVGQLMHRDVAFIGPGASIRRAAALMRLHGTGCLPVVHRHKLVGVLTVSRLLAQLEKWDAARSP